MKCENLIGQKFGKLIIIEKGEDKVRPNGQKAKMWWCKCECGNEELKLVSQAHLKSGHTKSCGCIRKEKAKQHCIRDFTKTNVYEIKENYCVGFANQNVKFIFDKEDYDKVKNLTWTINNRGYMLSDSMLLHRFILGLYECEEQEKYVVDHINHNKLDNRKCNLRICEQKDNSHNNALSKNNTSGVTGVIWMKDRNKWRAIITCDHKKIYLGDYTNFEEAVKARKKAENNYFNEFSYDNSMKIAEEQELEDEAV